MPRDLALGDCLVGMCSSRSASHTHTRLLLVSNQDLFGETTHEANLGVGWSHENVQSMIHRVEQGI